MTFEENLSRLEAIVAELEQDGVELQRALRLFEEGVSCLRQASGELGRAEATVKQLMEHADGAFELRDFDG